MGNGVHQGRFQWVDHLPGLEHLAPVLGGEGCRCGLKPIPVRRSPNGPEVALSKEEEILLILARHRLQCIPVLWGD